MELDKNIHRLRLSEIQLLYEADKKRLLSLQQEYIDIKKHLERERVLEALQLINCRAQLESELEQISTMIAELTERKELYDSLFMNPLIM